jgi:hypothetical protein
MDRDIEDSERSGNAEMTLIALSPNDDTHTDAGV